MRLRPRKSGAVVSRTAVSHVLSTTRVMRIISSFIALHGHNIGCIKLYPFRGRGAPSFDISPSGKLYGYFDYNGNNGTIRFVVRRRRVSCPRTLHCLTGGCGVRVGRQRLAGRRGRIRDGHRDVFVIGGFTHSCFRGVLGGRVSKHDVKLTCFHRQNFHSSVVSGFRLNFDARKHSTLTRRTLHGKFGRRFLMGAKLYCRASSRGLHSHF